MATAAPAHQRPIWNISSNGRRRFVNTELRGLSSDDGYPSAMTPSIVQDGGTPSSRTTSSSPRVIPKYQAPSPSFTAASRISMMAIAVSTVQNGASFLPCPVRTGACPAAHSGPGTSACWQTAELCKLGRGWAPVQETRRGRSDRRLCDRTFELRRLRENDEVETLAK